MVLVDNLVLTLQSIPCDAKCALQWLAMCLVARSSTMVSSEHSAGPPDSLQLMISGFLELCFGQFPLHSVSGSGEGEGALHSREFCLLSTNVQSPSGFILTLLTMQDPGWSCDCNVDFVDGSALPHCNFFLTLDGGLTLVLT